MDPRTEPCGTPEDTTILINLILIDRFDLCSNLKDQKL